MKKRILSCLMALALCLTLLPTAALAEGTEGTAQTPPAVEEAADLANGEAKRESQPAEQEEQQEDSAAKQAVAAVQAMIDALPDASELDGMDGEARESACLAASEAYDAYDALTEKQQSALTGAEKMIAILKWANEQVALAANEDLSSHTNHDDWTAISTEDGLKSLTGKGYLTDNITLTSTWEPESGVVLCLNGYSITGADGQDVITVNNGVTFTLCDCKGSGSTGKVTHSDGNGSGVRVKSGTFNMYGGKITGNTAEYGGVRLESTNKGKGSVFNMYGGSITGNNADYYGGGVYVIDGGEFYMYGGSITGNTAWLSGGGVYVVNEGSKITMSGNARIADNEVTGSGDLGGGVYVSDDATFTMTGGSITENMTSSGSGGVYVNGGTFTMTGSTIEKNTATDPNTNYGKGGGVYINGGTFTMTGGSITNNTALDYGGVCVGENAAFTVGGNVAVTENLSSGAANDVYLFSGKYITVDEKLDSTARIGVTCAAIESGKSVTVATGATGSCTKDNFFADKGEPYDIKVEPGTGTANVNVKLYNGLPHEHYRCNGKDAETGGDKCTGVGGHTEDSVLSFKAWTSTTQLPTMSGEYYLTKDVTLDSAWSIKSIGGEQVRFVLCLNGHSIRLKGGVNDHVINVGKGGTLALCDCNGSGKNNGIISGGTKASGVYIDDVGAFVMYGGSISGNGNGVTNKELFQMYGGSITGNDCGVVNLSGTFTMYDGSITGNRNTESSYGKGGGVCVEGGAFDMHGGSITGNAVSGSYQSCGGGVYVDSNDFTVSGDVTISGNTAGSKASNVYLPSDKTITVGGALGENAKIGVTTEKTVDEGNYVTVAKGKSDSPGYTLTEDDLNAFASDSTYGKQLLSNSVIFTNGNLHTHAVCGESCTHNGAHSDAVWQPISNESGLKSATAGHYYLANDIQLNSVWTPKDGVVLCLNGNSITANGSFTAINVLQNYTFTLTDCKGTGRITRTQGGTGRGVYMSGGTFNMYGGEITGNLVHAGDGGGVRVKSGTFNMYGGSITKNAAREASSGTGGNGGGVYVNGGTFKMNGTSKVTGNTASNGNGGGVFVNGNAIMTVSGGAQIQNNWKNGTLNADSGAYEQGDKGSANNLYLHNGATVTIDTLAETARIGITTGTAPENAADKKTKFATGANGDLDYATIFTPDAKDKSYVVNKEGTDLVLSAHQHSWTYALKTGTTDTITVSCACGKTRNYTIMAPSSDKLTYDGSAKAAKVEFEATTETVDFPATPTVTYQKKNGENFEVFSGTPTDAGTYRASITLGEGENAKTASVEYSIEKATPRVLNWMGYPRGWTFRENTPIANPTELLIANGTFGDVTRFEWYNATKNADNTYTEGAKLDGNPTDAGDYIIKAVFEESNNVYAAADAHGLTIGKAQHANNGVSIEVPLTVYPVSGEYTYDVDIAKALNNIPHGGGLEPNMANGGISTNLDLVRLAKWDNGKLYVTMRPLANITGTTLGSITVNLTSKNYTVVPVVVNITLQPKREVPDISVSMDNWTYGENVKTPRYAMMAGVEATVTYAAQGSSDFSTTVPTGAGNYTVKVQYETAIEIHTGKANFTIAPKMLTKDDLIHSGPITKVYDGSTNAPSGLTVSVKPDSLVGSDTLTVSGTLKYNSANVNEAKQIIFTPTAITTGNYALADTEVLTITGAAITKAAQAPLTVTSTSATYGEDLALTTDGGSGDGTVTYTVTDGTGEAMIVDGSKLHPTKAGTVSVTATKSGGDNYEDVTSVAEEITIGQADYTGTASKTVNIVKGRSTVQTGTLTAADFFPEGQIPADAAIDSVTPGYGTMMVGVTVNAVGHALEYLSNTNITATEDEAYTVTIAATNYTDISATLTFHPTDKLSQGGFKFENGSVPKTYGDGDFTLAATGEAEGSTVTYESNAPAVAEVDSATGKVTILKAGSTVITATAAETADYEQATATYTLTVGKKTVTVKAKDQSAYVGDKVPALSEDSYTVSGLVGEEKLTTQPTVKYVGADGSEITPDMTKTGEVKILASGAAASDNYTIRYEDGKLTVSTRPSGGGGSSRPSTHPVQAEVSKDPDGSVSLSKANAAKGDKVTITVKPERHYEVDEVIVRDSKGKQLAVKDNGDGTFTFEMPADKVTVEPTFSWVNPFADVANSAYYVDAVEWMLKREVTQGTTETTFSPNLNCTRAQIVTFLWRAAGSPEPKGTVSFADVSAGSYYAKAVAWAIENGITGGTGDGLFSPDATCTRAQSAAFLYRAAGSPAVGGSAGFSDVAADAYYAQAVAWTKEHGITDGIGGGLFGSANDCTRAQIAAFLWRLYAEK